MQIEHHEPHSDSIPECIPNRHCNAAMPEQFQIIASVYRGLIEILMEDGTGATDISTLLGIELQRITEPNEMLSLEQVNNLWQLGFESRGSRIGIDVAQRIRLVDFQDIGVFLTATADVADLLEQLANYCALFSNVMAFQVAESPMGLEVQVHYHTNVTLLHERLEFLTLAGPVLASQYLERKLNLDTVELTRPKPQNTSLWDEAFGTRVSWDKPVSRYTLNAEQAHRQVLTRNEQLKKNLQPLLDHRLRQDKRVHPLHEIHTVMLKQLQDGMPTTESVAKALHISIRTLHRRLSDADSSFNGLLSALLEDLSKSYLSMRMPVQNVADRLGYADARTFNRAFKRWTGMTVSQYLQALK